MAMATFAIITAKLIVTSSIKLAAAPAAAK
jgi:hypothetical protein